ncbi:vacuolar ATPase assembly integral membrane protein vma21 [Hanseniaspora valbyensis]
MADIPRSVVVKLLVTTVSMILFPLLTFFGSQLYIQNSVVNGGLAALAANIVLISYCVMAFTEKSDEKIKEKKEQ